MYTFSSRAQPLTHCDGLSPGFLENRGCAEKVVHRDHFIQVVRHGDDMHGHFSHCFLDRKRFQSLGIGSAPGKRVCFLVGEVEGANSRSTYTFTTFFFRQMWVCSSKYTSLMGAHGNCCQNPLKSSLMGYVSDLRCWRWKVSILNSWIPMAFLPDSGFNTPWGVRVTQT